MKAEEIETLKKAGKIASETVKYAKSIIKKGELLVSLAEKIEGKIIELGGKPAFPVNLSMNEIAAHATPSLHDTATASGLLKVDIGVHINGYVADTAVSIDLENSPENKKLIQAAEDGLKAATEVFKLKAPINQVGKVIEENISKHGFQSIRNLSGHSIEVYDLHAGIIVPNYDTSQTFQLEEGLYAIEPFSTTGVGLVKDGKPSGIYHLESDSPVRDSFAREVLKYIKEEYNTLPFCSRWIEKKFGTRTIIALKRLEEARIIMQYAQLVEKSLGKVAQAEHTVLLTPKEKIITTI